MKKRILISIVFGIIAFSKLAAQAPGQDANGCAAAHQRLQLLGEELAKLTASKQQALTGKTVHPGPIGRIGDGSTDTAHPDPAAAAEFEKLINDWHKAHDVEMQKLLALVTSGDCLPHWKGDDSGKYYSIRDGDDYWWVGMSDDGGFQSWGLSFCNVFRGKIKGDNIEGAWADVPRGRADNSGNLSLSFQRDKYGYPQAILNNTKTGPFSAKKWTPADLSVRPGSTTTAFQETVKNDLPHPPLGSHPLVTDLTVVKAPVVITGTMYANPECSFPADLKKNPRTFQSFWNDTDSDMDLCFNLTVDPSHMTTNFFDGISPKNLDEVKKDLPAGVHCESIMFGRKTDQKTILLPGWAETGGNSVLFNGVPIDANVQMTPAVGAGTNFVTAINGLPLINDAVPRTMALMTYYKEYFGLQNQLRAARGQPPLLGLDQHAPIPTPISGAGTPPPTLPRDPVAEAATLKLIKAWHDKNDAAVNKILASFKTTSQLTVRVTGVLCFDHGHEETDAGQVIADILTGVWIDPFSSPDADQAEVHPVYSIDVVVGKPSDDVSGVWGSDDGGTAYVHQVGNTVWGFLTRPYGDMTCTKLIQATKTADAISGDWIDVPPGTERGKGHVAASLTADKLHIQWGPGLSTQPPVWTKLR